MNKADKYYKENLKNILTNGSLDIDPRPRYKDGKPAHTKFITQVFETYDLSKGEFPITTLRNTAIKTGIKEILTIYRDQSNTKEGFHKNGVKWWDNWMNDNGDIGRSYSYNIESHREDEMKKNVVSVDPRIVDTIFSVPLDIKKDEILESVDNIIYNSEYRGYGDFIIVDEFHENKEDENRVYILCQYLNTGYKTSIRKDSLFDKGQCPKNNLIRTKCGIGYLDYYESVNNFDDEEVSIMKEIWGRMIKRCHGNDVSTHYEEIFVHQRWHSFKNFLNDVRYLPQYNLAKEKKFKNWYLDKDYYGSNCYSKDTCVFLNLEENLLYRKNQINPFRITDTENGYVSYELSYSSLSRKLNLSRGYTANCVKKGKYKKLKLEHFGENGTLYRYELSKNQLNELLNNLKNNPFGRRHIINFWNWSNIDKKELVECAYATHWSVREKDDEFYLDLTLIQRSQDAIMATYINKTQYVALQMMVAKHVGYKIGKFVHFIQNYHIYDRHIDAAKEILNITPLDINPYFELNVSPETDFYNIVLDDFKIYNISDIKKIVSPLEIAI